MEKNVTMQKMQGKGETRKERAGRSSKATDLIRSFALKHAHLRNNCRCEEQKTSTFQGDFGRNSNLARIFLFIYF